LIIIALFKIMKNIYLVGFMGTGKTTVGKILARQLNKEFVEMDEAIEARQGKKIVDIFAFSGEPYFRKLEKELLKELSTKSDLVVSCGGGLICDEENLKMLKENGTVFNLTAKAKSIYARTKQYRNRPLLNVGSPLKKIRELLKQREPYYAQAHYRIDTDSISVKEVARRIIDIVIHNG
jgi:shikimate kinase